MKKIYIIISIFVLILVIILVGQNITNKKENKDIISQNWKGKGIIDMYIESPTGEVATGIGKIPSWNDKKIYQKYNCVEYKDEIYEVISDKIIQNDRIGEKLENVTATGYDMYTNTKYDIGATIFKITELSEKCVVAVQFEGEIDYYSYINNSYTPKTLRDLVNDFNLKNEISFEKIEYNYEYLDSEENLKTKKLEFYDVNNEQIWETLFENLDLENILDYANNYFIPKLEIIIDIPVLGTKENIILTDDGYLKTYILERGKTFYIGKEKVESLTNYLIENYYAYRTIQCEQ